MIIITNNKNNIDNKNKNNINNTTNIYNSNNNNDNFQYNSKKVGLPIKKSLKEEKFYSFNSIIFCKIYTLWIKQL